MKIKSSPENGCANRSYNAKSCVVISKNDELNEFIKNFFDTKGYGVQIKTPGFSDANNFCKFSNDVKLSGFGIVIGEALFEMGYLYGCKKQLILNDTPVWASGSNGGNVVCLERMDAEGLSSAMLVINEKLKKQLAKQFISEKQMSKTIPEIKIKLEKLCEILSGLLLSSNLSLGVIRKNEDNEVTADETYKISEVIDKIENSGLEMSEEYYLTTGRFFSGVKEYKTAVSQFKSALKINKQNTETLSDIGTAYYCLKEYNYAIKCFKFAIESDENNVYAFRKLGLCYLHLKNYGAAIDFFKKAVKSKSESDYDIHDMVHEIFNDMGIAYNYLKEDTERYQHAIECFENSLKIKNNMRAWKNMGATFINLKRYSEAAECFKNAAKIEPENAELVRTIGGIYFRMKDLNNASEYFECASVIEPDNADTYYTLGLINKALKDYSKAISCFIKATELDPKNVDAWWDLGFTYLHLEDYNTALGYFEKASEIDGEYVDAWNCMGAAYTKLEKYDKAAECYDKVIKLLPDYVMGKLNMAENCIIRGEYDNAFHHAKEAMTFAKEQKNDSDICMSYFFGITSLLYQSQKIVDEKVLINEFMEYFDKNRSKVNWDFSSVVSEIKKSKLENNLKAVVQNLVDLLENRSSIVDFKRAAGGI